MSAATHAEPLLSEFPAHDPEQWRAAAEALLKGTSFESALVSRTYEGIDIPPILMRGDIADLPQLAHVPGFDSLVRGSRPAGFLAAGWEVSQELRASTSAELNTLIHEGFAGGQSELNIVLADDGQPGLQIRQSAELITALDGVILDAVSIWWQPQGDGLCLSAHFFDAVNSLGTDPASLRGGFQDDPLGELLQRGTLTQSLENRFNRMAGLTAHCARHAPQLQTICAVGDVHHNAGASVTQELAHVIATAVSYIEEMRDRGLDPAIVMPRIRIRLAVGSDIFMEIAKIRAARCLWSRIASIYGVTDAPVHIHASTSRWNKSLDEAYTNLLRVTAEAFAAVVGGADSLHIGPFDEITSASDAFSRRIARNLHAILREECGLDRVIDPAGGSYSVEWLTHRVAEQSWDLFRAIERRGGMIAAIAEGSAQRDVASTAEAKLADVRSRKQRLVGVNAYPDPNGKRLRIPHEKADDSAIHADPPSSGTTCIPLRPLRAAQAYELLRDA
jgi:methylmalonyl-CoA mutase